MSLMTQYPINLRFLKNEKQIKDAANAYAYIIFHRDG